MLTFKSYIDEMTMGQSIEKIKSRTLKKKKYSAAADLLRQVWDRKKKDKKHDIVYYASQIARQYPGVDARTLATMVGEDTAQNREEGTAGLVNKYKQDTPGQ
jgi:hypothetical protein